jgi:uncharacterized protein (DUF2147 family)
MRAKMVALIMSSVATLALAMGSAIAAEPSAAGLWQKLDDAGKPEGWFLVLENNGIYEGAIARMFSKPGDDPNPLCTKCSDDRKDMPWLGIPLIREMKRDGLNYEGGNILDPRDGKVYRATMKVSPDGQALTVRGFLGIALFGQDQVWKRLPDTATKELDPAVRAKYLAASSPPPQRPAPAARPAPKANANPKGAEAPR